MDDNTVYSGPSSFLTCWPQASTLLSLQEFGKVFTYQTELAFQQSLRNIFSILTYFSLKRQLSSPPTEILAGRIIN